MNKEFDRANSSTAPKSVRHLASKLLISLGVLVALSGCASYYGAAKISSVPAGAEVINLNDPGLVARWKLRSSTHLVAYKTGWLLRQSRSILAEYASSIARRCYGISTSSRHCFAATR